MSLQWHGDPDDLPSRYDREYIETRRAREIRREKRKAGSKRMKRTKTAAMPVTRLDLLRDEAALYDRKQAQDKRLGPVCGGCLRRVGPQGLVQGLCVACRFGTEGTPGGAA